MKRILLILSVILIIFLPACGNSIVAAEETPAPSTPTPVVYESGTGKVILSEIMSKNKAVIMDADGDFPDWIELQNITGSDIDLFGWTLTDGKTDWTFPAFTLYGNSRALIFASGKDRADSELHTSFSVKDGDVVSLLDRNQDCVDSCTLSGTDADISLIHSESGDWVPCSYPTPGYENTLSGYDSFCTNTETDSPLLINEICVENFSDFRSDVIDYPDWVELRNVSGSEIDLSSYFLSDDTKLLKQYQLKGLLAPGEMTVILCSKHAADYRGNMPIAPFSLNSENDRLYLSNSSGRIMDHASLKRIPLYKTLGRIDGKKGFFFLSESTPGNSNSDGIRCLPEKPQLVGHDGVYNNVDSVLVELRSDSDIFYTLDCSEPTPNTTKYTGPITLTETTVLRAISVGSGSFSSEELTATFFLNENHSLPVASLVCGSSTFDNMYLHGLKDIEVPAFISFYEDAGSFTAGCGVKMNGASSLVLNKKNLSLRFRGCYGDEQLDYDLFGGGITSFTNLVLRAGQDQTNTIVRNEACYQLASEFSDNILTMRFRYCILYIDGKYNGIYAIMEKPNEAHAASVFGVPKDSVEVLEASVYSNASMYKDVMQFAFENDLRDEKNYRELCNHLDVDSLIDWTLVQGFLGNYDLASGNLRYAHSSENDGKWRLMFYDLDCSFSGVDFIMNNVLNFDNQVSNLNRNLLKSPLYREALLKRASQAFNTVLTNEHMCEIIDDLCRTISPEVDRDARFSYMSTDIWQSHVDSLKNMICDNRWDQQAIDNLCRSLNVTPEEKTLYFGEK